MLVRNRSALFVTQLVVASLLATGCVGQNTSASELPQLAAESGSIAERFDGNLVGLSPAGDLVMVWEYDETSETYSMCGIETASGSQRFCIDDSVHLRTWQPDWAPTGDVAVFGDAERIDIMLVDLESGDVDNLTSDTGDSTVDRHPAFSPSGNRIVFHRNTDQGRSVQLYDRSEGKVVASYELQREIANFQFSTPPVMVDESRALIAADNYVYEINLASSELSEVLDYTSSFAPPPFDFDDRAPTFSTTLFPVGFLNDRRLLLYDRGIMSALMQTGAQAGGYSSGYLLADLDDGSLTPLFETSPDVDPWYGPFVVMQAGGDQLVVLWVVGSTSRPDSRPGGMHGRLSLLDLAAVELPVNPHELPELWATQDAVGLGFTGNLPGRSAQISADATLAIWATTDQDLETALLQLAMADG